MLLFGADKIHSQFPTVPDAVLQEHKMYEDDELGSLRGMIEFPCGCKARALIYEGSKGQFSVQCPICGKYTRFDSGTMSAVTVRPVRGAVRKLNLRKPPSR